MVKGLNGITCSGKVFQWNMYVIVKGFRGITSMVRVQVEYAMVKGLSGGKGVE